MSVKIGGMTQLIFPVTGRKRGGLLSDGILHIKKSYYIIYVR